VCPAWRAVVRKSLMAVAIEMLGGVEGAAERLGINTGQMTRQLAKPVGNWKLENCRARPRPKFSWRLARARIDDSRITEAQTARVLQAYNLNFSYDAWYPQFNVTSRTAWSSRLSRGAQGRE
jgi:hypothetical protein